VNPVTSAGVYSVIASLGCNIGIDSITVSNMAVSAAAANASFCPGGSATLTASGNAVSYLWLPDNTTGTVAIVNPAATAVYTLVSTADSFCTITTTLEVTVYSTPTVSIAGSNTVCTGSALTQTASGAATYSWNTGELTAEASFTPAANTSYTVIGFDNNMCSDTATVSIIIKALPNVTANSNRPTTICKGEGVTLTAGGATSYIWNNSQTTTTIAVSPTVTTTYTVTGTNAQGCSNATVYTQPVNACTGIAALAGNSPAVVIYPNPTTGKFIVSMEYITQTTIIEVYSATGQKLISRPVTATGQEIDLGEQAAGMYFVTIIRDNHEVFNAKIIRQ
jgi:hypothetical protein